MSGFSIFEAAFTGFRVAREHPRALVAWAVLALAASATFEVGFVALLGPGLVELQAIAASARPDPGRILQLFGSMAPYYLLFVAAGVALNAILYAAMYRAVADEGDDRFGYLRLGADELRQLGVQSLALALFVGVYIALVMVATVATVAIGGAAGVAPSVLVRVALTLVFCALVFLGVRLSLAPAHTFATGRIDLFGSWALTRSHFWPILATYGLTAVLAFMVYLLTLLVILAAAAVVTGGNPVPGLLHPDMGSLRSYFTAAQIVQTVLGAGVSALVWPLAFTPSVTIYNRLARPTSMGPGAAA